MKKKGSTESYSALIGIIIAFLMLTAIGCAVYNIYKPKGAEYFNRLTELMEKMDKAGANELNEPGEMPFYVDKDKVLIGFGKQQQYVGKKGLSTIINWQCYGITFGWAVSPLGPIYSITKLALGITGSIDRPLDKCPEGKSCLCLCKMSFVDEVKQSACKEPGVVCKAFDNLEFVGGEGCPQGVFIPGTSYTLGRGGYPTDVVVLHYKKEGYLVSIDAKATKTKEELEKILSENIGIAPTIATVIISSSCGNENNELAESLSLKFKHVQGMTPARIQSRSEGVCITPEAFADEIRENYKHVEYFLQIEQDNSLTDINHVIVNYVKDSSSSKNLAEKVTNALRNEKFIVKEGVSDDPYLKLLAQFGRTVEIKTSKGNTLPAEVISKAIIADKETFAQQYSYVGEGWSWPVVGAHRITSCYGQREGGQHAGIDIGPEVVGAMGDPIYSVGKGIVRRVVKACPDGPQQGCGGGYGNHIVINQENKFTVIYAHLMNKVYVEEGQEVYPGQQIGLMGDSGSSEGIHLHFGVYTEENEDANRVEGSINPVCLLDMGGVTGKACTSTPGTSEGKTCPLLFETEKERVTILREYLKTRRNVYFVPANWDLGKAAFDRNVDSHLKYTEERISDAEKKLGTFINDLRTDFNVLSLNYLNCKNIDFSKKMVEIRKDLIACITKSDPKITEESLKDAIVIGLTDDETMCGVTDSERTVISNYKEPSNTAHEWGHLMLFCDEYKFTEWLRQELDGVPCINPYPLCCKDNPLWEDSPGDYQEYLKEKNIEANCFPRYESLSTVAKSGITEEKYKELISKSSTCHGHVCIPGTSSVYCRGMMGPEFGCENKAIVYGNSVEFSYVDFDHSEDWESLFGIRDILAELSKDSEQS